MWDDTWCFPIGSPNWLEITGQQKPLVRKWMVLEQLTDAKLVLHGGISNASPFPPLGDLWTFTLKDGWLQVQPTGTVAPLPRFGHSSVQENSNGTILIFGGASYDASGSMGTISFFSTFKKSPIFISSVFFNDLWRLREGSRTYVWTQIPKGNNTAVPSPRMGHTTVLIAGTMYLFGGSVRSLNFNELWAYDIANDDWNIMNPYSAPSERGFHAACAVGLNMIIQGGEFADPSFYSSETWSYDTLNPFFCQSFFFPMQSTFRFNDEWNSLNDVTAPVFIAQHIMMSVSPSVCVSFGGVTSSSPAIASMRKIVAHPTDAKWSEVVPGRNVESTPQGRELFAATIFEVLFFVHEGKCLCRHLQSN